MNYKQLLTNSMVVIGLSCFSSLAFAKPPAALIIYNNTNEASTCRTHMGCSTDLMGAEGVTPAHSLKEFSDAKIRIACKDRLENCVAEVYMTNNCTGPVVASATFALKSGLKGDVVQVPGTNYVVNGTSGSTIVTIGYK